MIFTYSLIVLFFLSFLWALWSLKSEVKKHRKKHHKIGEENIIFSMYKKRGS